MDPLYQDIEEQLVSDQDFPDPLPPSPCASFSSNSALCEGNRVEHVDCPWHCVPNASSSSSVLSSGREENGEGKGCPCRRRLASRWSLSYYFPKVDEHELAHYFSSGWLPRPSHYQPSSSSSPLHGISALGKNNSSKGKQGPPEKSSPGAGLENTKEGENLPRGEGEDEGRRSIEEEKHSIFHSSLHFLEKGILGRARIALGCQMLRHTCITCGTEVGIVKVEEEVKGIATATPDSAPPPSLITSGEKGEECGDDDTKTSVEQHHSENDSPEEMEVDIGDRGVPDSHFPISMEKEEASYFSLSEDDVCPLLSQTSCFSTPSLEFLLKRCKAPFLKKYPGVHQPHQRHNNNNNINSNASTNGDNNNNSNVERGVEVDEVDVLTEEIGEIVQRRKNTGQAIFPSSSLPLHSQEENLSSFPSSTSLSPSSYSRTSITTQCTESITLLGGSHPETFYWRFSKSLPTLHHERYHRSSPSTAEKGAPLLDATRSSRLKSFLSSSFSSSSSQNHNHNKNYNYYPHQSWIDTLWQGWASIHDFLVGEYFALAHVMLRPYLLYVGWIKNEMTKWWGEAFLPAEEWSASFSSSSFSSTRIPPTTTALEEVEDLFTAYQFCHVFYWESSPLAIHSTSLLEDHRDQGKSTKKNHTSHPTTLNNNNSVNTEEHNDQGKGEAQEWGGNHLPSSIVSPSYSSSSPVFLSSTTSTTRLGQSTRQDEMNTSTSLGSTTILTTTTSIHNTTRSSSAWWWGYPFRIVSEGLEEEVISAASPGLLLHLCVLLPIYTIVGVPHFLFSKAAQLFLSFSGTPPGDSLVGTLSVNKERRLECCLLLTVVCLFFGLLLFLTHVRFRKYTRALQQAMRKGKRNRELKYPNGRPGL